MITFLCNLYAVYHVQEKNVFPAVTDGTAGKAEMLTVIQLAAHEAAIIDYGLRQETRPPCQHALFIL